MFSESVLKISWILPFSSSKSRIDPCDTSTVIVGCHINDSLILVSKLNKLIDTIDRSFLQLITTLVAYKLEQWAARRVSCDGGSQHVDQEIACLFLTEEVLVELYDRENHHPSSEPKQTKSLVL